MFERFNGRIAACLLLVGLSWVWAGVDGPVAALWPSVVALGMVILIKRVFLGLLAGAFSGALILSGGNPFIGGVALVETHLIPHFFNEWKMGALVFTLVLGGFAGVIERGGGLLALVRRCLNTSAPRQVEGVSIGLGLVCFFDGLANALIVGRLLRGFSDRAGVARAKLAYIVDTTSSAVACLAFISTWIAYQLSMIQEGFKLAGQDGTSVPYALFFRSIPYNFYCWFSLILLIIVVWKRWDLGPMKRAKVYAPELLEDVGEESVKGGLWWRAVIPLLALMLSVFVGIYLDGSYRLGATVWPVSGKGIAAAFGASGAALVLVFSGVFASVIALICYPPGRKESAFKAYGSGVLMLCQPMLILLAAWMLSSVLNALDAGSYLGALLMGKMPFPYLPTMIFLVGALISFTTGTSWGTMGILMPLAIPLVFTLGADGGAEAIEMMLPVVVGGVFSGAVFGDHCSPLSDTTIVSSIASGIEPHEHVKTQLPYALLAALVAVLVGFLPSFWIITPGVHLLVGTGLFLGVNRFLLRKDRANTL